jgi:hypothetical protein
VTALLALALAAMAPCPAALAAAQAPDDALAAGAPALVRGLDDAGVGPTGAVAAAAAALAGAEPGDARAEAAAAFRGALARHCALAAAPGLPPASAEDRAALAAVLARPELSPARLDAGAIRRFLVRLWDWLVELLGTSEAERYASLGRALFLGAAAAALVLVVAALRRRRERASASRRGRADEKGAGGETAPDVSAVRAEEALRRGDAREAIRLALLAALGALERAGRLPRGRAMTNEEIVRSCSTSTPTATPTSTATATSTATSTSTSTPTPTATSTSTSTSTASGSDLALLARAFDRAVYGGLPVSSEDARGAVERARRVVMTMGAAR